MTKGRTIGPEEEISDQSTEILLRKSLCSREKCVLLRFTLAFLSKKCLNAANAAESNKFGQRRNLEELVLI
jgi:hypothetical protein